ncbi:MAG: ACP S-malonyltransferase [Defluviitaleaceae bacterium]|nr:ACP S-malonyltransferase [Defluviitaleaceae bacterium]
MKVAFIFSGQGAQFSGMGRELYDNYDACKRVFDRAEEVAGFDLKNICFDETRKDDLNNTKYCQAAIFAHSMAAFAVLDEKTGVSAAATAGLSLGEYSALTYAGALQFDDAVKLLCTRGAYMAEACEATDGAMSAVMGITSEDCIKVCEQISTLDEPVNVSNINTIGQVVISGHKNAVEKAEVLAKEYGGRKSMRLPVSGAYHSPFMQPAADKLAEAMKGMEFHAMGVPVISNVDGGIIKREDIAKTLETQVCGTVKWMDCVLKLADLGVDTFIEMGPGKALSGFVKKIIPEATVYNIQDTASLEETLNGLKEVM